MTEIAERIRHTNEMLDHEGEIIHPGTLCFVMTSGDAPPEWRHKRSLAVYCGLQGRRRWMLLLPRSEVPGEYVGWNLASHIHAATMDRLNLRRFDATHYGWWPGEVEFLERALGFWCPEHRAFHATETCPTAAVAAAEADSSVGLSQAAHDSALAQLRVAQERERAAVKALEDFKAKVREVGGQYAEEHSMCGVYEECMADLGLKGSEDFSFEVEVTFRTKVTTAARTKDAAEARVLDADWRVDLDLSSDYEVEDTGVDNLTTRIVNS